MGTRIFREADCSLHTHMYRALFCGPPALADDAVAQLCRHVSVCRDAFAGTTFCSHETPLTEKALGCLPIGTSGHPKLLPNNAPFGSRDERLARGENGSRQATDIA